jgi:hypothetical protein
MNPHNVSQGHGKQIIGIMLAEIRPLHKGQAGNVGQGGDVRGFHAQYAESVGMKGHMAAGPV